MAATEHRSLTTDLIRHREVPSNEGQGTDLHLMAPINIIQGKAAWTKGQPPYLNELKEATPALGSSTASSSTDAVNRSSEVIKDPEPTELMLLVSEQY